MSGSVKQDKKRRTWFYVADVPSAGGGRKQARARGFRTKKEAEAALAKLMSEVRQGVYVPNVVTTLSSFLNETWLPSITSRVQPTTADGYRRIVKTHIVPALGGVKVQALSEPMVEAWVANLVASGLNPKTVRNIHAVLSKAMADAIRLRLVSRNAASKAMLPKVFRPTPRAWREDDLRVFLGRVKDDRWAAMWRLLATTGMRRGEVLGLRWADVDLDEGSVNVVWQRTVAGGRVAEGQPKTNSGLRTVALDPGTVASLRAWRKVHHAERLAMGPGWVDPDGHMFTWPDGQPLWPQTITRWFKNHCTAAGLPTIGVHGLRHTAATWLISSGESPKVVSQRLGHSHVSITLQLYSHVLPGHDRAAADKFGSAIDGPS
jgi:integrase